MPGGAVPQQLVEQTESLEAAEPGLARAVAAARELCLGLHTARAVCGTQLLLAAE